jgi:hypothetical protein
MSAGSFLSRAYLFSSDDEENTAPLGAQLEDSEAEATAAGEIPAAAAAYVAAVVCAADDAVAVATGVAAQPGPSGTQGRRGRKGKSGGGASGGGGTVNGGRLPLPLTTRRSNKSIPQRHPRCRTASEPSHAALMGSATAIADGIRNLSLHVEEGRARFYEARWWSTECDNARFALTQLKREEKERPLIKELLNSQQRAHTRAARCATQTEVVVDEIIQRGKQLTALKHKMGPVSWAHVLTTMHHPPIGVPREVYCGELMPREAATSLQADSDARMARVSHTHADRNVLGEILAAGGPEPSRRAHATILAVNERTAAQDMSDFNN